MVMFRLSKLVYYKSINFSVLISCAFSRYGTNRLNCYVLNKKPYAAAGILAPMKQLCSLLAVSVTAL
jgi:hypothetical protein